MVRSQTNAATDHTLSKSRVDYSDVIDITCEMTTRQSNTSRLQRQTTLSLHPRVRLTVNVATAATPQPLRHSRYATAATPQPLRHSRCSLFVFHLCQSDESGLKITPFVTNIYTCLSCSHLLITFGHDLYQT